MDEKKRRRAGWWAIGAVVMFLTAVAVILTLLWPVGRPFGHDLWEKADHLDLKSPRLAMADWLIANKSLRSKTRDEVVAMLGVPPETQYFRDEWDLVYCLGPKRGLFRIDSEWLVVRFDPDNRVAEYRIVTD